MDSTRNLIDYAMDSNGVEFRNELYASIHDRVTAAIESKKQELAGSLIRQEAKEEDEEGAGHEKAEKKMMKSLDKNGDGKHTMADHRKEEIEDVSEADKHSFIGRIQRHNELKNKVDRTWRDAVDAENKGDKSGATRAFNKHVRYTNLERPGTWRTVKDQDITEMDKSEPSAGRDGGPREGPEKIAKTITKEKMVNHALDALSKSGDKEKPKTPNAFTMKSKGPSDFAKSSSGGKTKETKTGRTHSSGDRY